MSEHNHENCNHNHDHDNDHEYITLVDEDGNESLFEILLTVDGEEEFGKSYVLLYPAGANDDEEDIELLAYAYEEAEDGLEGELKEIETDAEWDMIEEVLGSFMAEEENQ